MLAQAARKMAQGEDIARNEDKWTPRQKVFLDTVRHDLSFLHTHDILEICVSLCALSKTMERYANYCSPLSSSPLIDFTVASVCISSQQMYLISFDCGLFFLSPDFYVTLVISRQAAK